MYLSLYTAVAFLLPAQAFSKPIADLFIGAVAKKNPLSSKKCLIILFFYYISLLL